MLLSQLLLTENALCESAVNSYPWYRSQKYQVMEKARQFEIEVKVVSELCTISGSSGLPAGNPGTQSAKAEMRKIEAVNRPTPFR